jgi:hypothetical protein
VTSVQKRIEPEKSFSGALVDPTEARNAPGSNNDLPALELKSGNRSFPAVPREVTRENGLGGEPGTETEYRGAGWPHE